RVAPASAEEIGSFCHLRVAQGGWRVAQAVRFLHQEVRSMARRATSNGASRTFIVHHARRAEQVARRTGAKSI
ncbi:hypothetical protein A2U01_0097627, partial [Trifolium medium]|nr:hypothetical protein [Trifolium medium]